MNLITTWLRWQWQVNQKGFGDTRKFTFLIFVFELERLRVHGLISRNTNHVSWAVAFLSKLNLRAYYRRFRFRHSFKRVMPSFHAVYRYLDNVPVNLYFFSANFFHLSCVYTELACITRIICNQYDIGLGGLFCI